MGGKTEKYDHNISYHRMKMEMKRQLLSGSEEFSIRGGKWNCEKSYPFPNHQYRTHKRQSEHSRALSSGIQRHVVCWSSADIFRGTRCLHLLHNPNVKTQNPTEHWELEGGGRWISCFLNLHLYFDTKNISDHLKLTLCSIVFKSNIMTWLVLF